MEEWLPAISIKRKESMKLQLPKVLESILSNDVNEIFEFKKFLSSLSPDMRHIQPSLRTVFPSYTFFHRHIVSVAIFQSVCSRHS